MFDSFNPYDFQLQDMLINYIFGSGVAISLVAITKGGYHNLKPVYETGLINRLIIWLIISVISWLISVAISGTTATGLNFVLIMGFGLIIGIVFGLIDEYNEVNK